MESVEEQIGGEGIVVEIDESKFGKRMYHKGHRVKGVWVVGGVERTEARRIFAIRVQDRKALTMYNIIKTYVLPGSIIHTDCWAGYTKEDMDELLMEHRTVNHTYHFVNPADGTHTNTIEGTWAGMKQHVPKKSRTEDFVEGELQKFIWMRKFKDTLWERLLEAIRSVTYDE
jgi:transposase-like protein